MVELALVQHFDERAHRVFNAHLPVDARGLEEVDFLRTAERGDALVHTTTQILSSGGVAKSVAMTAVKVANVRTCNS